MNYAPLVLIIVVLVAALTRNNMPEEIRPPVCDYEGSDYQTRFWEKGGREYEDRCEAIAIQRLLPKNGSLMLELGAGAGRNTQRYSGFERVVLLDYSRTQLKQAQDRLGRSDRYIYVAADIYRLPFRDGLFDAATMIRVLHHMADAPAALRKIRDVLQPGAVFILEYANKQNGKAILRYFLRRQTWSPFSLEPIEFAPLNFDFHPKAMHGWLKEAGFHEERILTVSHFRIDLLKRIFPPAFLAGLDSIFQWTGALWQISPSIFVGAKGNGQKATQKEPGDTLSWFKCPECGHTPLTGTQQQVSCPDCKHQWNISDGIYDFRGE
jgi:SAM-dependent methyltransferase